MENLYNIFVKCNLILNRITTPDWNIKSEPLECHNLLFVYDGRGFFERNGVKNTVQKGDLVYFEKGDRRYMNTDKNNLLKIYTVNFLATVPFVKKDDKWGTKEAELPFDFVTHIKDTDLFSKLCLMFSKLCNIHISDSEIREFEERELFSKIIFTAMYASRENINCCNFKVKSKIDESIKYMITNCKRKITVEELSEIAGLSASHFSLMFRKITGKSPVDYLIKLKINNAKLLLKDGASVGMAAEEAGFADVYYFSRMFKKMTGVSPSEYKKSI